MSRKCQNVISDFFLDYLIRRLLATRTPKLPPQGQDGAALTFTDHHTIVRSTSLEGQDTRLTSHIKAFPGESSFDNRNKGLAILSLIKSDSY